MNLPSPRLPSGRYRARRGSALVVLLSFILLLSGLIVAYFARSDTAMKLARGSSSRLRADLLARSALENITGNLRQEIANGSTAKTSGSVTLYLPLDPAWMLPVRNGIAASGSRSISTLMRISSPGTISGPGVDQPASQESLSTTPSKDGRQVSRARWNRHYLLPRLEGAGSGDATPIEAFTAPSWVYVTSGGPAVLTSPTSSVLGRYAYAVYDEGALVDLNVAGYPSQTSAAYPRRKGPLAFADLKALGLAPAVIDQLIGWRNHASARPDGDFSAGFTFSNERADAYSRSVLSNTTGFLKVNRDTWNGRTDQKFVNRQELLAFQKEFSEELFPGDALQYLGTFSRGVTAPAWMPETSTSANPGFLSIRFSNDATVDHYRDDGTVETTSFQSGDPAVQRRFSLARIAWLTHSGAASPALEQPIRACFGLKWNSAEGCWDYVGSSGDSSPSTIKTLEQVVRENREPNFFEMLKGAILQGSLGKTPGAWGGLEPDFSNYKVEGVASYSLDDYYGAGNSVLPDLHLIQIGANIIDQWDSDNYPTAIYFNAGGNDPLSMGLQRLFNTAFGVEDLPYLTRLEQIAYRYKPDTLGGWLQPELWNPHQRSASTAGSGPSQFRIVCHGALVTEYNVDGGPEHTSAPVDYDGADSGKGRLYFDLSGTDFRSRPEVLTTSIVTQVNRAKSDPICFNLGYGGGNAFAAFYTGGATPYVTPVTPGGYDAYAYKISARVRPVLASGAPGELTVAVEYLDSDGVTWRPYHCMKRWRVTQRNGNMGTSNGSTDAVCYYLRPDPRTDRFGISEGFYFAQYAGCENLPPNHTFCPNASTNYSAAAQIPRTTSGFVYLGNHLGDWAANQGPGVPPYSSGAFGRAYYSDPDGVVRPGDAFCASLSTGDGCPLFHGGVTDGRRDLILNHPFRSVAELGYVFRDLPFKTLDFWSAKSGDAALLDAFSVSDEPPLAAGYLNPANAPVPVLQSVIQGSEKMEADAAANVDGEAPAIARDIADSLAGSVPLRNRADLVTRLDTVINNSFAAQADKADKHRNESVIRALAPVANFRTWNLMIDVIAQVGKMPPNSQTLNDFRVEGESRYWLHIAIDRFTGEIVDQQLEAVFE